MRWLLPTRQFRDHDTGRVLDLHVMMSAIYEYWYHRGMWNAFTSRLCDFLNCVVLWVAVFMLSYMFDWDQALRCTDAECAGGGLVTAPSTAHVPGAHRTLVVVFLIACGAASAWELLRCVETWWLLGEVHDMLYDVVDTGYLTPLHSLADFLRKLQAGSSGHTLLRSEDDLPLLADLTWSDFLSLVCRKLSEDKGIRNHRDFNELRAIQVLMVYDNYYIALHHHGVLTSGALVFADDHLVRFLIKSQFDDYNTFDPSRDQLAHLRTRLTWYLAAYVVLYPFIVSYFFTKLIVKNAVELRTRPGEFFARDWSNTARWVFRLYNEVPHVADTRLAKGRETAAAMRSKSSRPSDALRVAQRIAATIAVAILFVSFLNPQMLTIGLVGSRTLFWWLSGAGLVYAAAADVRTGCDREYCHLEDLQVLMHHLHYDRDDWYGSASRFCDLLAWEFFHSRAYTVAASFVRILAMPLVLSAVYFDGSLNVLIAFMSRVSRRIDGVGCIAEPSTFAMRSLSHESTEELADVGSGFPAAAPSFEAKKEKSIASFAAIYDKWAEATLANDVLGVTAIIQPAPPSPRSDDNRPPAAKRAATAHERERLNVSRVDDSYLQSRRSFVAVEDGPPPPPRSAYGT